MLINIITRLTLISISISISIEGSVSQEDWSHYGLALDKYTHFTSPIRRLRRHKKWLLREYLYYIGEALMIKHRFNLFILSLEQSRYFVEFSAVSNGRHSSNKESKLQKFNHSPFKEFKLQTSIHSPFKESKLQTSIHSPFKESKLQKFRHSPFKEFKLHKSRHSPCKESTDINTQSF